MKVWQPVFIFNLVLLSCNFNPSLHPPSNEMMDGKHLAIGRNLWSFRRKGYFCTHVRSSIDKDKCIIVEKTIFFSPLFSLSLRRCQCPFIVSRSTMFWSPLGSPEIHSEHLLSPSFCFGKLVLSFTVAPCFLICWACNHLSSMGILFKQNNWCACAVSDYYGLSEGRIRRAMLV